MERSAPIAPSTASPATEIKVGGKGGVADHLEAADYVTGKSIPAEKGYYPMGKELPGGRGPYPLFAFGKAEDVMKYFLEKGGIAWAFRRPTARPTIAWMSTRRC